MNLASPLFAGFTDAERADLLSCGCVQRRSYGKDEMVLRSGDQTGSLGIVLSGSVRVESVDLWGNRSILASIPTGDVFAEAYAITATTLLVSVVAATDCEVMFLDAFGLYHGCHRERSWHPKIISNLLMISSHKNLASSTRTFQTSFKRCRPRISAYLSAVALQEDSQEFDIPFDRQELADYLNLDRSALSKELMRMRAEGLISYQKNHFVIYGLQGT